MKVLSLLTQSVTGCHTALSPYRLSTQAASAAERAELARSGWHRAGALVQQRVLATVACTQAFQPVLRLDCAPHPPASADLLVPQTRRGWLTEIIGPTLALVPRIAVALLGLAAGLCRGVISLTALLLTRWHLFETGRTAPTPHPSSNASQQRHPTQLPPAEPFETTRAPSSEPGARPLLRPRALSLPLALGSERLLQSLVSVHSDHEGLRDSASFAPPGLTPQRSTETQLTSARLTELQACLARLDLPQDGEALFNGAVGRWVDQTVSATSEDSDAKAQKGPRSLFSEPSVHRNHFVSSPALRPHSWPAPSCHSSAESRGPKSLGRGDSLSAQSSWCVVLPLEAQAAVRPASFEAHHRSLRLEQNESLSVKLGDHALGLALQKALDSLSESKPRSTKWVEATAPAHRGGARYKLDYQFLCDTVRAPSQFQIDASGTSTDVNGTFLALSPKERSEMASDMTLAAPRILPALLDLCDSDPVWIACLTHEVHQGLWATLFSALRHAWRHKDSQLNMPLIASDLKHLELQLKRSTKDSIAVRLTGVWDPELNEVTQELIEEVDSQGRPVGQTPYAPPGGLSFVEPLGIDTTLVLARPRPDFELGRHLALRVESFRKGAPAKS